MLFGRELFVAMGNRIQISGAISGSPDVVKQLLRENPDAQAILQSAGIETSSSPGSSGSQIGHADERPVRQPDRTLVTPRQPATPAEAPAEPTPTGSPAIDVQEAQDGLWVAPLDSSVYYWSAPGEISYLMAPTGYSRTPPIKLDGVPALEGVSIPEHLHFQTDGKYYTKNIPIHETREEAVEAYKLNQQQENLLKIQEMLDNNHGIAFWAERGGILCLDEDRNPQHVSADEQGHIAVSPLIDIDPYYGGTKTAMAGYGHQIAGLHKYKGEGGLEEATRLMQRQAVLAAALQEDSAILVGDTLLYNRSGQYSVTRSASHSAGLITEPVKFLGLEEGEIARFAGAGRTDPISFREAKAHLDEVLSTKLAQELLAQNPEGAWKTRNGLNAYMLNDNASVTRIQVSDNGQEIISVPYHLDDHDQEPTRYSGLKALQTLIERKDRTGAVPLPAGETAEMSVTEARNDLRDRFQQNDGVLVDTANARLFVWDDEKGVAEIYYNTFRGTEIWTEIKSGENLFDDTAIARLFMSTVGGLRPVSDFITAESSLTAPDIQAIAKRSVAEFHAADEDSRGMFTVNEGSYELADFLIKASARDRERPTGKGQESGFGRGT